MGLFGRDEQTPEPKTVVKPNDVSPPARLPVSGGNRTIIAQPTRVEGKILGSGDILVEGKVKGTIDVSGNVQVTEHGRIDAKVHARSVLVGGRVKGDISATERIKLDPSAHVEGNMTAPRILIEDGATFEGQVIMKDPEKKSPLKVTSARKEPETPSKN